MALSLLGTACAVFYHKEVVEVPDPSVLTDPRIAQEASGTKLVFQDLRTGRTEKAKFLGATDSTVKVLSRRTEKEVRPSQMTNARLELSAGKMTPQTCVGSTCCGVTIGGILGWFAGKSIYDDFYDDTGDDEPSNCIDVFVWLFIMPIVFLVALALALLVGAAVALLVLLLSLFLGNVVLPNLFLNSKVKEIIAKAQRLRSLIAQKSGG